MAVFVSAILIIIAHALYISGASQSGESARNLAVETVSCSIFKKSLYEHPWLLAETTVTGLSNQLTAVYSYIPTALLFNTNLLLGCMYSRKNFEITMRQFDAEPNGKKVMSFRDFFDWGAFKQGWRDVSGGKAIADMADLLLIDLFNDSNINNGNDNSSNLASSAKLLSSTPTLQQQQPQYCLPAPDSAFYKDIKRTRWRSASDDELLAMANASNVSVPLQAPSIVRFASKFKMMALYNFERGNASTTAAMPAEALIRRETETETETETRRSSKSGGGVGDGIGIGIGTGIDGKTKYYPSLLEKIHHSVRPSRAVQTAVDAVLNALPRNFWAAHIRVEGDVIRFFSTSSGGGVVYKNRLKAKKAKERKVKHSYVMLGEHGTTYSLRLACPTHDSSGRESGTTSSSTAAATVMLYMNLSTYKQQLVNQSVDEDSLFYDELPNVITSILQSQCVREYYCTTTTTNNNNDNNYITKRNTDAGSSGISISSSSSSSSTTVGVSPSSSRKFYLEQRGSPSDSDGDGDKRNESVNAASSLPPLYVASGIFRSGSKSFLQRRSRLIIDILQNIGFPRVHTRFELLESGAIGGGKQQQMYTGPGNNDIDRTYSHEQINGFNNNATAKKMVLLDTELAAYVDLEVAKRAKCFIPAHMSSSFSYMVQRLVELDRGQMFTDVQPPHRQFRNFFF